MHTPSPIRPVPSDHPLLVAWCERLRAQSPHFSHAADYQPGMWLGLHLGEGYADLKAAYGYTLCVDGTVAVEYAMCEPSRAGKIALDALTGVCYQMWAGKTVRFHCEKTNRKMRSIVERLGAKPVAYLYELQPAQRSA